MDSTTPATAGGFEPRITAFVCNWCTYTGADLAGTSRLQMASNVRIIRLPRHGASCPVGMGLSCSADRSMLAKIDKSGIWLDTVTESGQPKSTGLAHNWKANYHDVRALLILEEILKGR